MKTGRRIRFACVLTVVLLGAARPIAPENPVVDAARHGDLAALRALIAQGADVNQAEGDGMTALHWAALSNHADAAALLIGAGAALDRGTRIGAHTPLHVAAQRGSAAVARLLVDAGGRALVDARTTTGATALHLAAGAGHVDVTSLLLAHGADPNAQESAWNQTPLVFAAAWNRADVIRVLLQHGADAERATRLVDIPERARLAGAARRRGQSVLKQLLATDQKDVTRKATLEDMWKAEDAAREVLRSGVIPPDDKPPQQEEPQEFDDIMDYNVQVGTMGGMTPLLHAVRQGHVEATVALLDGGANLESAAEGTTPLLMAAINGHFDLAMLLLERGARANVHNSAGNNALYAVIDRVWAPKTRHPQLRDHEAQKTTHLQLLEALLQGGADPNLRLEKHLYYNTYFACMNALCGLEVVWGATPFWRAAYALDLEAMKLLVAHGADPNIPVRQPPTLPDRYWMTGQGMGALSRVKIEWGDPSGLDPVPVGGPAVYPIHAAAGVGYGGGFAANAHRHVISGWMRTMKYLVEELGADVNVRDHLGYNALHHAASRGDNEMVVYLVEHGADVTAVSRRGQTTADMANGPWERLAPFPATIELLERMGSANNHMCVSC
jgi:ankyrin repeat protein